ncbi:hypothetical protein DL96DRAFT_1594900 [Flagelloscypha sp. PMI_526]|nr:hypothetical protein DL96DRAFT_1594900 [Flagelloscypha sp. PMI_526]
MSDSSDGDGIRTISFDGGLTLTSGLSQLYILKEVLHRLAFDLDVDEESLKPCDHFDLFAGTGLGGVYVVLFTRLRMTVDEVIEFHHHLEEQASPNESRVDELITDKLGHSLLEEYFDVKDSPKGFVCVVNPDLPLTPRLLRTYRVRENFGPRCTIRQALLATLADGVLRASIPIAHDQITTSFVFGNVNFSNPTAILMKEIRSCFPKAKHVSCIVNLGSGPAEFHTPTMHPPEAQIQTPTMASVPQWAHNSEQIASTITAQCHDLGPFFFRLSIDQLSKVILPSQTDYLQYSFAIIIRATQTFLLKEEITLLVDDLVSALVKRPPIVSPARLITSPIDSLAGEDGRSELYSNVHQVKTAVSETCLIDLLRPNVTIPNFGREHSPCLVNTRVDIIGAIHSWVDNQNVPNVCVLRGHPGTGKSTIATSVAQSLAVTQRLGAQFFCRREQSAEHNVRLLWRLVALDIIQKHPSVMKALSNQLGKNLPDVDSLPVEQLFDTILAKPLAAAKLDHPLVVVIDALDEFGGRGPYNTPREELLETLRLWKQLPPSCRLFMTTRWQENIGTKGDFDPRTVFTLEVGKHASAQSSNDIRSYYQHHFPSISDQYTSLPKPWPSVSDLELLVKSAAGLFIWASTVVKLAKHTPSALNGIILKIRDGSLAITGEDGVDGLYRAILDAMFPEKLPNLFFKEVTGAIITAHFPLSSSALSRLLSIDELRVEEICKKLQPVLDTTETLSFLHQSFADFLLGDTCPERFRSYASAQHLSISTACLAIINGPLLHFNMGRALSSDQVNDDSRLQTTIPEHVRYACRSWATHLTSSPDSFDEAVSRSLIRFFETKLLFWLEVMSIEDAVGEASRGLSHCAALRHRITGCVCPLLTASEKDHSPDCLGRSLKHLVQDSLSFVRNLVGPISKRYPHLYLSALPFAPPNSLISQNYRHTFSKRAAVLGLTPSWSHAQEVSTEASVLSVAFSPDGQRIVSGCSDRTVRVWDADIGAAMGPPLRGHDDWVTAVAFCSEGSRIVSGSMDGTMCIWDIETWELVGTPLRGHKAGVLCVAVSRPDKNSQDSSESRELIVSGSMDKTLRLWIADTGKALGSPLSGHDDWVTSVAFSPNSQRIVSGSLDKTVRLWDARTRRPIGDPLQGHTDGVTCVDWGATIVSGSRDKTVRQWNGFTGEPVGGPFRAHQDFVTCLSYRPYIISGSRDMTVHLWEPQSYIRLSGHQDFVEAVAFSSDGRRIVSGSRDKTLRIWDLEAVLSLPRQMQDIDLDKAGTPHSEVSVEQTQSLPRDHSLSAVDLGKVDGHLSKAPVDNMWDSLLDSLDDKVQENDSAPHREAPVNNMRSLLSESLYNTSLDEVGALRSEALADNMQRSLSWNPSFYHEDIHGEESSDDEDGHFDDLAGNPESLRFINSNLHEHFSLPAPQLKMTNSVKDPVRALARSMASRRQKSVNYPGSKINAVSYNDGPYIPSSLYLRKDGWIVNERERIPLYADTAPGESHRTLAFDFTNFQYGRNWTDCYTPGGGRADPASSVRLGEAAGNISRNRHEIVQGMWEWDELGDSELN